MPFRHEWKIEINPGDYAVLRSRLSVIMKRDSHGKDGCYQVRSLYFDDPLDRALQEKIDGVDKREKFRIRCYNGDLSFLRLEKKSRLNGLCSKDSAPMSAEEVEKLLCGETKWMADSPHPLIQELYCKMKTALLSPKTVVEYMREPFVYPAGNVRVTFDRELRTSIRSTDFLSGDLLTVPAGIPPILMEVKYDAFLPDLIREAIALPSRQAESFSKYAQCRIYG